MQKQKVHKLNITHNVSILHMTEPCRITCIDQPSNILTHRVEFDYYWHSHFIGHNNNIQLKVVFNKFDSSVWIFFLLKQQFFSR